MKKHELHETKIYLDSIACHLREGPLADLHLSITWSVVLDDDSADTIIRVAENGEDAEGAGVFGRCELIAMATHGRSGWQHWVLGSMTERVLGATKLPLLIVRSEETDFKGSLNDGEPAEAEV
jgi:nucleotide-binding universal stress UspA family protein